jgi:sarcosine oxidase, subunit gamma
MPKTGNIPMMRSPLHPFGLNEKAKPMDASCGVWANEVPLLGYISLHGNPSEAAFVGAASTALGQMLPTEPCTFSESAGVKVMWLSPDEWMIVCPRDRLPGLLNDLDKALTGVRSQVNDNSGGYTQALVQGAKAAEALSHCTVYDLHSLEAGRVVGTTFGKSAIYLHRHGQGYCLLFRRSFADYIWRYLVRAAEPYGFGVARLENETRAEKGAAP